VATVFAREIRAVAARNTGNDIPNDMAFDRWD
jgi:hypothetical protein